jgi:hypothetical protein
MFSQTINLPIGDSILSYPIIIKHIGDSTKYTEYAFYKTDTTKIAWKFFVNNNDTLGIYREYFLNGNTLKKLVYGLDGEKNGIYQEWNEEQKLAVSGKYRNNKKQGQWIYFLAKRNEVYKKGVKHGRWRIYEGETPWNLYVYKKGKLVKVKKDILPFISKRKRP